MLLQAVNFTGYQLIRRSLILFFMHFVKGQKNKVVMTSQEKGFVLSHWHGSWREGLSIVLTGHKSLFFSLLNRLMQR